MSLSSTFQWCEVSCRFPINSQSFSIKIVKASLWLAKPFGAHTHWTGPITGLWQTNQVGTLVSAWYAGTKGQQGVFTSKIFHHFSLNTHPCSLASRHSGDLSGDVSLLLVFQIAPETQPAMADVHSAEDGRNKGTGRGITFQNEPWRCFFAWWHPRGKQLFKRGEGVT